MPPRMPLSRFVRCTVLLLITLLLANHLSLAKPADPAVIKVRVQERGVGQGVRVSMADHTEAKGVIVNIGEQSFTVTPRGSTAPQEIAYAQVTAIHKDKMGTGTKVIIIVAIAGAAIGITAAILDHDVHKSLSKI